MPLSLRTSTPFFQPGLHLLPYAVTIVLRVSPRDGEPFADRAVGTGIRKLFIKARQLAAFVGAKRNQCLAFERFRVFSKNVYMILDQYHHFTGALIKIV